jgi:hypothetical protein
MPQLHMKLKTKVPGSTIFPNESNGKITLVLSDLDKDQYDKCITMITNTVTKLVADED